jgi:hypothetical protein
VLPGAERGGIVGEGIVGEGIVGEAIVGETDGEPAVCEPAVCEPAVCEPDADEVSAAETGPLPIDMGETEMLAGGLELSATLEPRLPTAAMPVDVTGGGGNGASGRRDNEAGSEYRAAPRVPFADPRPGRPGTAAVGLLLALPSSTGGGRRGRSVADALTAG